MILAPESDGIIADRETGREAAEATHGLSGNLAWFAALLVLSSLLGFILSLAGTLNRDFPPGLLQNFVELPWPFV